MAEACNIRVKKHSLNSSVQKAENVYYI